MMCFDFHDIFLLCVYKNYTPNAIQFFITELLLFFYQKIYGKNPGFFIFFCQMDRFFQFYYKIVTRLYIFITDKIENCFLDLKKKKFMIYYLHNFKHKGDCL